MSGSIRVFSVNEKYVYEDSPSATRAGERWLCSWSRHAQGCDRVVARWLGEKNPAVLSPDGQRAGTPKAASSRDIVWVVWEAVTNGTWEVWGRRWTDGDWLPPVRLASDAFDPVLAAGDDGTLWCLCVASRGGKRSLQLVQLNESAAQPLDIPVGDTPCYRPKLAVAGPQIWISWETYRDGFYRIRCCPFRGGRAGSPEDVPSGPYSALLHDIAVGPDGQPCVAWVQVRHVVNKTGVVDQLQTVQAARRSPDGWVRLPEVTRLDHGMLVNAGYGGYVGNRRRPMLACDGQTTWVLWERKEVGDAGCRGRAGVLCGKKLEEDAWSEERALSRELVEYSVVPGGAAREAAFVARDILAAIPWSTDVLNVFPASWGNLVLGSVPLADDAPAFNADVAVAWDDAVAVVAPEESPRRSAQFGDEQVQLYWGDPHFHTAQTGDAEGEVDELLHYARDKARLDFCAICDNDVYCQPLSDLAWFRQARFLAEHSEPGEFVVIPAYEWSWADPETRKPNHRLILFAKPGESVFRQHEPEGQDIHALAASLSHTSGLLIGHHLGWVFAESDREAAIEIASAWSPHMVVNPGFIHDTLRSGRRLGFTGGSDSHRRNPGLCGALTGIYAASLTVEALVEAVWHRRIIATTGSRIAIDFRVGNACIGDDVQMAGKVPVSVHVWAPGPLASVAVVRDGDVIREQVDIGEAEAVLEFEEDIRAGCHWYYARAVLTGDTVPSDGHENFAAAAGSHAWTSPIWITANSGTEH